MAFLNLLPDLLHCFTTYAYAIYGFPYNFTYLLYNSTKKQGKSEGFDSCDRPSNLTLIGFKSSIFQPVWPWNLMDDQKNNRAPLLCYFKLFASFRSHWWIQTGVTVRKRLIWVKIDDFFLAVLPWNLTDDFQKQQDTSSLLLQPLCSIL